MTFMRVSVYGAVKFISMNGKFNTAIIPMHILPPTISGTNLTMDATGSITGTMDPTSFISVNLSKYVSYPAYQQGLTYLVTSGTLPADFTLSTSGLLVKNSSNTGSNTGVVGIVVVTVTNGWGKKMTIPLTFNVSAYHIIPNMDNLLSYLDTTSTPPINGTWTSGVTGGSGTSDFTGVVSALSYDIINQGHTGDHGDVVFDGSSTYIFASSIKNFGATITDMTMITMYYRNGYRKNNIPTNIPHSAPRSVCIDPTGSFLYIAELARHCINQMVISTGVVTRLAGIPDKFGSADGAATTAMFCYPNGLCIDPNGSYLLVADSGNHSIRKIDLNSMTVTTVVNGTLNYPNGLCIDAVGNHAYIADKNVILMLDIITGVVTTVAGSGSQESVDGVGIDASFMYTFDVCIDPDGSALYVAEIYQVRKIAIGSWDVTTVAGNGSWGMVDGIGSAASFNIIKGIAIDPTGAYLLVADEQNSSIRKIVLDTGNVVTFDGNGVAGFADGSGMAASFSYCSDVCIDKGGNYAYVADSQNGLIRKVLLSDGVVSTIRIEDNSDGTLLCINLSDIYCTNALQFCENSATDFASSGEIGNGLFTPNTLITGTGYFCRAYTRSSGGRLEAFYNGEFDGSQEAHQAVTVNNEYICIGKNYRNNTSYLNGVVKTHLVYNTILTGDQIKQVYTYLASLYS